MSVMDGVDHGGGDLLEACEAELLERHAEPADAALAELAHEGRRDRRDDLVTLVDCGDSLEYLALVGDGAEGAVHQALPAGDALVVVDVGTAVLVV